MTLENLYLQFSTLVYNLALRYVEQNEDAEEITQDVFINIHHKLKDFEHKAKVETWIYRITINKSIDFIRAKKRKKRLTFSRTKSDTIESLASSERNPEQLMQMEESIELLMRCIHQLPEKQQTAIILLKIEQKSQKEVAEIMETSPKAVESLFQRAKANLKKNIEKNKG